MSRLIEESRHALPQPQAPSLKELIEKSKPFPPITAILGITNDERTLLARLLSPEVRSVAILGGTDDDRARLLATIGLSLLATNTAGNLDVVRINVGGRANRLDWLSQAIYQNAVLPEQAHDALLSCQEQIEKRRREGILTPKVVLFIDIFSQLQNARDDINLISRLAVDGFSVGVHVVASMNNLSMASCLGDGFRLRLVGKVNNPAEANLATGFYSSGADRLFDSGDFLAVAGRGVIRFIPADPWS